jgi:4-hydroxybenzoate polyprenyltransferase
LVALPIIMGFLFLSGIYEVLYAPVQLVLLKAFLVSCGFLVAYMITEVLLPKVDYGNDNQWQLLVKNVVIYVVVIYCFAVGG